LHPDRIMEKWLPEFKKDKSAPLRDGAQIVESMTDRDKKALAFMQLLTVHMLDIQLHVQQEVISEKLDSILRVLSIQVAEGASITERVRLLSLAGLDNVTIAEVLNTSPATIRSLASRSRARGK